MRSLQTLFIDLKCRSYINCAVKKNQSLTFTDQGLKLTVFRGKKNSQFTMPFNAIFPPHTHLSNNHGKVRINNEQYVFTFSTFCVLHMNF